MSSNTDASEKKSDAVTPPEIIYRGAWATLWHNLYHNIPARIGLIIIAIVSLLGALAPVISTYVTHYSFDGQHTDLRLMPPGSKTISTQAGDYDGKKETFSQLDFNGDRVIDQEEQTMLYWKNRFLLFLFDDYDGQIYATKNIFKRPDGRVDLEKEYPKSFNDLHPTFKKEFIAWSESYTASIAASATSSSHNHSLYPRMIGENSQRANVIATAARRFDRLGLLHSDDLDTNKDHFITPKELMRSRRSLSPAENRSQWLKDNDANHDERIEYGEYLGAPLIRTFYLGSDHLGRDVLTRILYGARISMLIALLSTLVSFIIGVTWGSVAGYMGGRVDNLMMRIVDVLYGLPFMFIVILMIVIFGRSTLNLFIALGAVQWLTMSRIVRGQVLSLKHREFVEAARIIGASRFRIIFRHLLPNAMGPVIVYATLLVPGVILEEAFLSFLGLGVQPPNPSWGNMISEGVKVMDSFPWLLGFPAIVLSLTLFCMNFIGDGLRDSYD